MIKNLEIGLFKNEREEKKSGNSRILGDILKEMFKNVLEKEEIGGSIICVIIENENELSKEISSALRAMLSGLEIMARGFNNGKLGEEEAREVGRVYRAAIKTIPVKVRYRLFYFEKKANDVFVVEI